VAQIATGEAEEEYVEKPEKDEAAAARAQGRRGSGREDDA
jgi:hypothetical protein